MKLIIKIEGRAWLTAEADTSTAPARVRIADPSMMPGFQLREGASIFAVDGRASGLAEEKGVVIDREWEGEFVLMNSINGQEDALG